MTDRQILWGGLTLGQGDSGYLVTDFSGWDEMPGLTDFSQPRVRSHGDHLGDQFSQARIVTVSGMVVGGQSARDSLVQALLAATPVTSAVGSLTVDLFGEQLTSQARVVRRSIVPGATYEAGSVPFAIQWRCSDPLRYGAAVTASTGLATQGGGLAYPLTYALSYGAASTSGALTLSNPGTASAPIVFVVAGPLTGGFELSGGGMRLTYPFAVPDGQPVTIDTGLGTVTVEGTADRRTNLTNADWMQVPAGSSLSVYFTSLDGSYSSSASVQATVKPAYW